MTRKDFLAMAAEIALLPRACDRLNMAITFSIVAGRLNPRFNRALFMEVARANDPKNDEIEE